jgi:hypothetical protein
LVVCSTSIFLSFGIGALASLYLFVTSSKHLGHVSCAASSPLAQLSLPRVFAHRLVTWLLGGVGASLRRAAPLWLGIRGPNARGPLRGNTVCTPLRTEPTLLPMLAAAVRGYLVVHFRAPPRSYHLAPPGRTTHHAILSAEAQPLATWSIFTILSDVRTLEFCEWTATYIPAQMHSLANLLS